MVSVTVLVVSVWLVIEPWVKLGTTGTDHAGAVNPWITPRTNPRPIASWNLVMIYLTKISVTNCPVALVPAPPAVIDIVPAESILPARLPDTPPELVVTLPNAGKEGTTPLVTVVLLGIASLIKWLRERECISVCGLGVRTCGHCSCCRCTGGCCKTSECTGSDVTSSNWVRWSKSSCLWCCSINC